MSQNKLFKQIVYKVIKRFPINFGMFLENLPNKYGGAQFGDKIYKIANFIYESDESSFYERLISNVDSPRNVLLFNDEKKVKFLKKCESFLYRANAIR